MPGVMTTATSNFIVDYKKHKIYTDVSFLLNYGLMDTFYYKKVNLTFCFVILVSD